MLSLSSFVVDKDNSSFFAPLAPSVDFTAPNDVVAAIPFGKF
jgi:hypothetical protein